MEDTVKLKGIRKEFKKISRKFWVISNIFIIPLSFYFGGILAQMIRGYGRLEVETGGQARKFIFSIPGLARFYLHNPIVSVISFFAFILGFNIFAFYLKLSSKRNGIEDEDRNFSYSEKDTYGTSRWMNQEETESNFTLLDEIDHTDNMLVGQDCVTGKYLTLADDAPLNNLHRTIIGGSGSGKSAAVIQNDIFQFAKKGESMVLTDPSGELFSRNAPWLRKQGYNVKVFNLVNLAHSDSWNCLGELEEGNVEVNAQIFADVIIKNTDGKEGGDFWSKCAMNLLKAVCLYVVCSPIIPHNLGEAYKILTSRSMVEMDQLFDALPYNEETEVAHMAYKAYKNASDTVRGNVLIDLGSRLQVFQAPVVRKITSYDEINLKELGEKKSAYFVITSDQHSAFDFLAVLFYTMLFIKLVERAQQEISLDPKYNMKLPVHVNFLLDEFANIGAIPDFTKKISTVRKYGMNISVVIQSLAQLQNRYPKGQWEEILSNCCIVEYLAGGTDQTTSKYISEQTGTATVVVESQNHDKNMTSMLQSINYKESQGLGKRAIMNPDEVMQMDKQEALIFLQGQKPKRVKKIWYYKRPEYNELQIENTSQYNPEWRKHELEEKENNIKLQKEAEKAGSLQEEYENEKKNVRPLRDLATSRAKQNGKPVGFD